MIYPVVKIVMLSVQVRKSWKFFYKALGEFIELLEQFDIVSFIDMADFCSSIYPQNHSHS